MYKMCGFGCLSISFVASLKTSLPLPMALWVIGGPEQEHCPFQWSLEAASSSHTLWLYPGGAHLHSSVFYFHSSFIQPYLTLNIFHFTIIFFHISASITVMPSLPVLIKWLASCRISWPTLPLLFSRLSLVSHTIDTASIPSITLTRGHSIFVLNLSISLTLSNFDFIICFSFSLSSFHSILLFLFSISLLCFLPPPLPPPPPSSPPSSLPPLLPPSLLPPQTQSIT